MNIIAKECTLIRQLLLKSRLDELTVAETARLNTHIKGCPDCRSLHLNLSLLPEALAVNEADPPFPKPEIQLLLRQRVRELKSVQDRPAFSIAEIVVNILKRPVPLYQAAVVLLLIFSLVVYFMQTGGKDNTESQSAIKSNYPSEQSYEQYINYYPAQSALPMKVGISAAEDTSFKSFLFSAL